LYSNIDVFILIHDAPGHDDGWLNIFKEIKKGPKKIPTLGNEKNSSIDYYKKNYKNFIHTVKRKPFPK